MLRFIFEENDSLPCFVTSTLNSKYTDFSIMKKLMFLITLLNIVLALVTYILRILRMTKISIITNVLILGIIHAEERLIGGGIMLWIFIDDNALRWGMACVCKRVTRQYFTCFSASTALLPIVCSHVDYTRHVSRNFAAICGIWQNPWHLSCWCVT